MGLTAERKFWIETCRQRQKLHPLIIFGFAYCEVSTFPELFWSISMPYPQLHNYLRANRRRLALSQADVAFLLGAQSSAKVCHYENFTRVPSLEAALALEAIYKRSVSELFGGLYQQAERKVAKRTKMLLAKVDSRPGGRSSRKRNALINLART